MDRPTVQIYERESARYESLRSPRLLEEARRFGRRVSTGLAADLGSGPGWYTAAAGQPAVAMDAAAAMLRRTAEVAPGALLVQGELERLPFRVGALGGAWARNTYVHVRGVDLPIALADLHRSLRPDAPIELTFIGGHAEGRDLFPDDDLPGRWFSTWSAAQLVDLMHGAGLAIDPIVEHTTRFDEINLTVRGVRDRTLPDTVGPNMQLLVCGLNPSLHAADAGVGFVTPGNRFWPAAIDAGLVTQDREPRHALLAHGVGMTDLVKRATPRADALSREEYRAGLERIGRLCEWLAPAAVCFVGLAGWRAAVDRKAVSGWQVTMLGETPVYVMPSTSGLNAASSLGDLTAHLRAASQPA